MKLLLVTDQNNHEYLIETTKLFNEMCNQISAWEGEETGLDAHEFSKRAYKRLREQYSARSSLVSRALRHVYILKNLHEIKTVRLFFEPLSPIILDKRLVRLKDGMLAIIKGAAGNVYIPYVVLGYDSVSVPITKHRAFHLILKNDRFYLYVTTEVPDGFFLGCSLPAPQL